MAPQIKLTVWPRTDENRPFDAAEHNRVMNFSNGHLAAHMAWVDDYGVRGLTWNPSTPLLTIGTPASLTNSVQLGDAAGDAISILGTATFTPLATFTGGLTSTGTGTFNGALVANGTVALGDAAGDTVTITGNTTVVNTFATQGSTTLGNAAADVITVTGTATFTPLATFTGGLTSNGPTTLGDAAADAISILGTATFTPLATFAAGATLSGGVLTLPVGSAAAPSLAVGESNTGLFRQAAGALGVTLSGTERYRFEVGGVLMLSGGSSTNMVLSLGRTGPDGYVVVAGSGGVYANSATAGDLVFRAESGNELLFCNGADGVSTLRMGAQKLGFYETAPIAQPAAGAAATDLASVITLANALRTGLRGATGLGLFS
jgi:hypothetical protein